MSAIRTFRFRLKPSASQHVRLREALERSRQLYNAALEERVDCYRKTGKTRSYMDQCQGLTALRADGSPFAVTLERAPLKALALAYNAFFRKGGFPRFKGKEWFKTISWTQAQGWRFKDGAFEAKGLGRIRVHQHRPLPSQPVSAKVKREGRHWYLLVGCEIAIPCAREEGSIGLDLGLTHFAALSDGTFIPNPRLFERASAQLRRQQRRLARCKKGSAGRRKVRAQVAATHGAIRRGRRTQHFQIASSLVRRYSMIAVENLNVKGLASGRLAKQVNDAAWAGFLRILADKAESAGCQVVGVNPRHTSQTCPACGTVERKDLSQRVHDCACGYRADRDVAAARVILHRAVHGPDAGNVGGCAERSRGKAAA